MNKEGKVALAIVATAIGMLALSYIVKNGGGLLTPRTH